MAGLSLRDIHVATASEAECRQWLRANALIANRMDCPKCNAVMSQQTYRRYYVALPGEDMLDDRQHTERQLLRIEPSSAAEAGRCDRVQGRRDDQRRQVCSIRPVYVNVPVILQYCSQRCRLSIAVLMKINYKKAHSCTLLQFICFSTDVLQWMSCYVTTPL